MPDFSPIYNQEISREAYAQQQSVADLRQMTNEMIDTMLALIAGCSDEDVFFVPEDPDAYDDYASDEADISLAWTLGHVIVHTTSSAEEAAFLAAELARGVPMRVRRSRYEVPWESVTTIAQCRQRLEESRRMRLASLDMWPDEPDLENFYLYRRSGDKITAPLRFLYGLWHDDDHIAQIGEIVRQARAARETAAK